MLKRSYQLGKYLLSSGVVLMMGTMPAQADWTLEKSIQYALQGSPEQQIMHASIRAKQADLDTAGTWPNPRISMRAQNRLGIDSGTGGYNLDQITFTQALPLWRIHKQQAVANKILAAEEAGVEQSLLAIQTEIAQLYYTLLLNHEALILAKKRLQFTDAIIKGKARGNSGIIRHINPLDQHRMELLHEQARYNLHEAEAKYEELLHSFRLRLQLPEQTQITLPNIRLAASPQPVAELQQKLEQQSVIIKNMEYQLAAKEAGIALEKTKRFGDLELTLTHEKDILAGRRQSFQGISLNIAIPFWNQGKGSIARAEAESEQVRAQKAVALRNLSTQLQQNHVHLSHLLEQARSFPNKMIEPAEHLLNLTRQSYAVGEVNSITLIDAYNNYFNALQRHMNLIYQSNIAAVSLYHGVGDRDLYQTQIVTTSGESQ
ncbi:MAG: hypothetical protein COB41_03905 [Proteobacteria bacterium]|nr:MAG: hypothetical protein COB41_03905 [Pseudomonadota bacterium]